MKEYDYFTLAEAAALCERFGHQPNTKAEMAVIAAKQGWRQSKLCRPCVNNETLEEFHYSLLPPELIQSLLDQSLSEKAKEHDGAIAPTMPNVSLENITERSRDILEARLALLQAVSVCMSEEGCKLRPAIMRISARSLNAGPIRDLARVANARSRDDRGVSSKALYSWRKLYREGGMAALLDKPTKLPTKNKK